MRRVGCRIMSRKLPPCLAAVLGLERMICSGSTPIPFFLLAADKICLASSVLPLAISHLEIQTTIDIIDTQVSIHLGDSGSQ